jgi:hypothetical protein
MMDDSAVVADWTSSNPNVVTVKRTYNLSHDAEVTAVGLGQAWIRCDYADTATGKHYAALTTDMVVSNGSQLPNPWQLVENYRPQRGTVALPLVLCMAPHAPLSVTANTTQDGTVSGSVLYAGTEKPVANLALTLHSEQAFTAKTDSKGNFQFKNVPFGQHKLYASSDLSTPLAQVIVKTQNVPTILPIQRLTAGTELSEFPVTKENSVVNVALSLYEPSQTSVSSTLPTPLPPASETATATALILAFTLLINRPKVTIYDNITDKKLGKKVIHKSGIDLTKEFTQSSSLKLVYPPIYARLHNKKLMEYRAEGRTVAQMLIEREVYVERR